MEIRPSINKHSQVWAGAAFISVIWRVSIEVRPSLAPTQPQWTPNTIDGSTNGSNGRSTQGWSSCCWTNKHLTTWSESPPLFSISRPLRWETSPYYNGFHSCLFYSYYNSCWLLKVVTLCTQQSARLLDNGLIAELVGRTREWTDTVPGEMN